MYTSVADVPHVFENVIWTVSGICELSLRDSIEAMLNEARWLSLRSARAIAPRRGNRALLRSQSSHIFYLNFQSLSLQPNRFLLGLGLPEGGVRLQIRIPGRYRGND